MEDSQTYCLHREQHLCDLQHAKPVDHQLWIFLRIHRNAFSQLQVNDVYQLVRHDHHIRRSKTVRHVIGNVHFLFHGEDRISTLPSCLFDLANHKTDVIVHRFQQVIGIVIRYRAAGLLFQVLFNQVFCQCMASRSFRCIRTLFLLKCLSQH